MINERYEVMQYLRGENLHRPNEYRVCLLLAKYFYEQGYKTVKDIREQLTEWAKANKFYFTAYMNSVAQRVIDGDMKLLGDEPVYINENDIQEITGRFDSYYERMVALGVLCYAKIYADKNGDIKIPIYGFAYWLNMNHQTVTKYLQRAEDLEYIRQIEVGETKSWYQTTVVNSLNKYHVNVPLMNSGEYQMADNDIESLYDAVFYGRAYSDGEIWYSIPGYHGWYQISNYLRVRVAERSINGRVYPSHILQPFQPHRSNKLYVNLFGEDGKQKKVSIEKLWEMSHRPESIYMESKNVDKKNRQKTSNLDSKYELKEKRRK